MTSPFAAIDAVFNHPRDAVAVMFLIEDSSYMVSLWPHLTASYLPPLLNSIKVTNSAVAEVLWMTSSEQVPFRPPFDPFAHRTSRWDDIPAIKFSSRGGSTISPDNVTRAIEALSATFGRGLATRHLVIIAAINPPADALGPRGTLAWSSAVERLHHEEIRVHLILRSQSAMDGLTPLYWDLIGKGHAYQSFADDARFAFYLCDFHGSKSTDKGKAPAVDNQRVSNSGLRSIPSSGSPTDKPSLVYQIQKMNGMEKKRRSRTRRDQPTANKPGEPYQKSPHTRPTSSTTQPASPGPSGYSPSRRKDSSRVSKVDASPSYFDARLPNPPSDGHRPLYSSTTSPSRSSSPSSPYHLSAGTPSSSPDLRNLSPSQAPLPIPTSPFDHFQHMALGSQSSLDSLSPTSPSYHEFQNYSHELPRDLRVQHPASQAIPVDGSHFGTQFNDVYGPDRSCWNEYGGQQGQIELTAYPRSLTSHPPDLLAPRLAHRPEQVTTTSFLPPTSHSLSTPPTGNPSGSYFYPDYEDCAVRTSAPNTYLLADQSSGADSSTTVPYYS